MLSQISENLQKGKAKIVKQLVQEAIDAGISAQEILEKGLIAGMNVVGEKFRNNEIFVPEVLVAARALNMGSALLKPLLAADGVKAQGKVCIGTVQGEMKVRIPSKKEMKYCIGYLLFCLWKQYTAGFLFFP